MSIRPVDPAKSRIVLVGTPAYDDPDLTDVPVVANNVADLAEVFLDPAVGGFSAEHVAILPARSGAEQIGDVLVQAAAEAEDLLLFYYSGHGLLDRRSWELYLSLAGTRRDLLAFGTALRFDAVRRVCLESRAANRVVILDSCYSARVIGETLGDADEAVLGQLQVAGTYTLTSAASNRVARIVPGERHTAFTGRLLNLLRTGVPDAGPSLSLGGIYQHLLTRLSSEALPVPQVRGTDTADLLGLVRNCHVWRILAEAEQAARRIEDEYARERRLRDVAEAMAVGDPDRAEQFARAIDEDRGRSFALCAVAKALAGRGADRDRVRRVFADAELAARGLDGYERAYALRDIAVALAESDPGRAGLIITRGELDDIGLEAWYDVAVALAGSDPDRAERITRLANELDCDRRWAHKPSEVLKAMTLVDPDRAERFALMIDDDPAEAYVLGEAVKTLAGSDPDRAERIAHSIDDGYERASALCCVAEVLAGIDAEQDRVRRVLADAERIARGIEEANYRAHALCEVATAMAAIDPDRAEQILHTIDERDRAASLLWVYAMSTFVETLAARDPDRAERIAHTMDDSPDRVDVLCSLAEALTGAGADRGRILRVLADAERAAQGIDDSESRDSALCQVVKAAAGSDPGRAERIARTIGDREKKVAALLAVARAAVPVPAADHRVDKTPARSGGPGAAAPPP